MHTSLPEDAIATTANCAFFAPRKVHNGGWVLDTVDKSVVLWYNEEKRTGVFLHGEQLSTARYVRCDVGNSQAVHNRKQGNVGRERKGYPSISEWRVLDFENGSTMERPAAGIW